MVPYLMVGKVKSLMKNMNTKNKALIASRMALFKTKAYLFEENLVLDSSRKTVDDLELSLSVAQEG